MSIPKVLILLTLSHFFIMSVQAHTAGEDELQVQVSEDSIVISRSAYKDKLHGFWLGQSIANWTALTTEMDKIGNIGDIKSGDFYTREHWGKKDLPNIWGKVNNGEVTSTIGFILKSPSEIWGADDDTDIEYIYQNLLLEHSTALLSPEQIKNGWLRHIKKEEENYLWVSNQQAFDLMQKGVLPPETGTPELNKHYDMIDAQLTTEIFGLYAPCVPSFGKEMAYLPIRTVASKEAVLISEFYVEMHSFASLVHPRLNNEEKINRISRAARKSLPDNSYPAKMYDFVWSKFESGISWEQARDSVYVRYQVNQKDGYDVTSRNLHCNGCFAAGINFAAGLVSLFYGRGDLRETIKIGALTGWDSDNPTSTWGGLLGFIYGKGAIELAFNQKLSSQYNIHRTRINFPNDGLDDFDHMSDQGIKIIDDVVVNHLNGRLNATSNEWVIPITSKP